MDEQSENFRTNFKVKDSAPRQGRNPATGETIEIAASPKLGFSPAKQVRDALAAWGLAAETSRAQLS
jgi:DNA-binding protein HU-beta